MSCVISSPLVRKAKMRASKKPAKTCANAVAAHVSDKARLRKARQQASLLVKGPTHISIWMAPIGFNKTKSARRRPLLFNFNNCLVRRRLEVGRLLDGRLGVADRLLQIALGFLPLALALERRIVGRFADALLYLAGHLVRRTLDLV